MSSPIARPPNAITFPAVVRDREHDSLAEAVVQAPAFVARKQARDFQQLFLIFRFHLAQQRVAGGWRPSQAKTRDCFAIQAAVFEISGRDLAFVALIQLAREKYRRLAMHFH